MKNLLPLFLCICLSGFCNILRSQDIIYLHTGDTLRGKIDKANDQFVYFYPAKKGSTELQVFSVSEIIAYSYNQYIPDKRITPKDPREKRFLIEAAAGIGVYLGDGANFLMPDDVQSGEIMTEYMKKLRVNASYTGTFGFFITENIGVNLKYSHASFSHSLMVAFLDSANRTIPGYIKDNIEISYIAPGLTLNWPVGTGAGYILVDLNIGYLSYKNEAVVLYNYGLRGETFCMALRASGGLSISPGIFITMSAGFISAQLPELDITYGGVTETYDLNQMEYLDASRLDLQLGLSVKF